MKFASVINRIVPKIDPARDAALAAISTSLQDVWDTLNLARMDWLDTVEELARMSPATLRPKLTTTAFPLVARVATTSKELREQFDKHVPIDLYTAQRAAERVSMTDAEFTAAAQIIQREAERLKGKAGLVSRLVDSLQKDMAALDTLGDSIFSDSFTVAPTLPFGNILDAPATKSTTSMPAQPSAAK